MSEQQKVVPMAGKAKAPVRRKTEVGFQFHRSTTKQRYPVQLAADFGTEPGPWVAVNVQGHVFAAGWLPKKRRF